MRNKDEEELLEMIDKLEAEQHPEFYKGYSQCIQDMIKELDKQ